MEGENKRGGAGWLSSLMHLSSPSRVIKFLYSPAPPPPTVWALKSLLWASCAENHLCTYDLYSPVHNVLDACISITRGCVNHRCINSYISHIFFSCCWVYVNNDFMKEASIFF